MRNPIVEGTYGHVIVGLEVESIYGVESIDTSRVVLFELSSVASSVRLRNLV
jgi:hypothetical protein